MPSQDARFRFRIAEPGDAEALASFINLTYHGPAAERGWTPETHLHKGPRTSAAEIAAHAIDPDACLVVCEDGDGLLGCALIEREGDVAHFGMFAVRTQSQNGGAGKAVLAEAERQAVSRWKSRAMKLSVMSPQDRLLAYYERRGYRQNRRARALPLRTRLQRRAPRLRPHRDAQGPLEARPNRRLRQRCSLVSETGASSASPS